VVRMKHRARRSVAWTKYSDSEFSDIVFNAMSYKEIADKCGLPFKGRNNKTIKDRIQHLGLSVAHFHPNFHSMRRLSVDNMKSYDDILVIGSSYNRGHLKRRLLADGLLSNICSECGLSGEWNGKPIVLQLDHINGISNDNRLDNLRLLCPNCHSQTDTFAGRAMKSRHYCECGTEISKVSKVCSRCLGHQRRTCIRPDISELTTNISDLGYLQTGKKYGVSDTAIRKWIRSYGIDPKSIQKIIVGE